MAQRYELDVALDSSGVEQGAASATNALAGLRGQAGLVNTALKAAVPIMAAYAGTQGLGAVISAASQLESQMATLRGQVGLSADEVQRIREQTMQLAETTGQATSEITKGYKFARSAGLDLADANDLVETASMAAAAGIGQINENVRQATTILEAYGDEFENAGAVIDSVVASAQQMELEVDKLGGAVQRNVGVARELDIGFTELTSSIGAVSEIMGDANRGGRLLQGMMTQLLSPTNKMEQALKRAGTSAQEVRDSIAEDGLVDTMVDLRQRLESVSDEGLGLIFSQRRLEAALNLTNEEGARTREIMQNIGDTTNQTRKAFDDTATSQRNYNKTMNNLDSLLSNIGDGSLPAVNSGLEETNDLIDDANIAFERFEVGVDGVAQAFDRLEESTNIDLPGWVMTVARGMANPGGMVSDQINEQMGIPTSLGDLESPGSQLDTDDLKPQVMEMIEGINDPDVREQFEKNVNELIDQAVSEGASSTIGILQFIEFADGGLRDMVREDLWQTMVDELESLPSPIEQAMDEKIMVGGVEFDLSRSSVSGQDQLEEFQDPFGNTGSVGPTPPEGFLDMDAPFSGIDEKLDEEAKSGAENTEMRLSQAARNVSFDFERNLAEGIRTGFDGGADIGESLLMDLADTASQNMAQGIMDSVTQGLMESTGEETIAGMTKSGLSGLGGWIGSFFDTPGVQEVGPQGGAAGFAPGDKFVAGKSEKSMRQQLSGGASGGATVHQNVENNFPVVSDQQIDRRIQKAAPRIAEQAKRETLNALRGGGPDAQAARNA